MFWLTILAGLGWAGFIICFLLVLSYDREEAELRAGKTTEELPVSVRLPISTPTARLTPLERRELGLGPPGRTA